MTRELDPLGLVLKGGLWYLVAAADGRPRTYRVSSILELDPLEAPAARPPRFDLATYWTAASRDFEARLLGERAEVSVSPEGLSILRRVSPAAAEALEAERTPAAEGWIRGQIPIESLADAVRILLYVGAEAIVIGPPALRAALTAETTRIGALYV